MPAINPATGLLRSRVQYRDDIADDVVDRLLTRRGQRLHRPDYGLATGLTSPVSLSAADAALAGGAVSEVSRVSFRDARLYIDATAPPAKPGVRFFAQGSGYIGRSGNPLASEFFELPAVDYAPPDAWVSQPPAGRAVRMQFRRNRIVSSARFRIFMDTPSLWDAGEAGYADQWENWWLTVIKEDFAQDIGLHRPGAPSEFMQNTMLNRYQFDLSPDALDNFIVARDADPDGWAWYVWEAI